MSNFLKTIGLLVIVVLTTTLSFGQSKQQSVLNLTSPFQNKTVKNSSAVIAPKSNIQRSAEKPKVEIKNGSFFIDLIGQTFLGTINS